MGKTSHKFLRKLDSGVAERLGRLGVSMGSIMKGLSPCRKSLVKLAPFGTDPVHYGPWDGSEVINSFLLNRSTTNSISLSLSLDSFSENRTENCWYSFTMDP
jgi:hypothetical protein